MIADMDNIARATSKREIPVGAVPLDSPFYVKRDADTQLKRVLEKPGTTAVIRGAPRTGRTSLLVRGVDYAKKLGASVVFLDFQTVVSLSQSDHIDSFFRHLAHEVADRLQADPSTTIDLIWQTPLHCKFKMTRFIEKILSSVEGFVVLAMDEADILLQTPFYADFFSLLRAWHNRRVLDDLWRNLNVVIAISTHPSLLIDDIRQSPFNVGRAIRLDEFSEEQVWDLNQRYGKPLQSEEISEVMDLLGGHPYLVRQALFTLVEERMTWPELVSVANREDGPFGEHLGYCLNLLRNDAKLMKAMRGIVVDRICPEGRAYPRLSSTGLMRQQGQECICRYGLYKRFFEEFFRR